MLLRFHPPGMHDPDTEHELPLHCPDGTVLRAKLETRGQGFGEAPEEALFWLELHFAGRTLVASSPDDFFDALLQLRAQLESEGLLLGCYGSSRNVYPSGMDRNSSSSKAYRSRVGKQSGADDRVNLFDTGPDVEPVTIAEQEAFRSECLAAMRRQHH